MNVGSVARDEEGRSRGSSIHIFLNRLRFKANHVLSLGALVLADRRWCFVDRARPVSSTAAKHLSSYGSDIRQRFSVSAIANKKKILVTGFFKIISYFAAFVFIRVIGLLVGAMRSMRTVCVSVAKNRNTNGVGNRRHAGRTAAKALGIILGNQSVKYLEACRLNVFAAALDEYATATPVVGGIGRIVSDVGFLAAHIKFANCRRSDTDAATL